MWTILGTTILQNRSNIEMKLCDKVRKKKMFFCSLKNFKTICQFRLDREFLPVLIKRTRARYEETYSTSVFEGFFRMLSAVLFRKTILLCWTSGSSTFPYVRKLLACFCAFFPALVISFFICIAEKLNMSMRSYFFFTRKTTTKTHKCGIFQ